MVFVVKPSTLLLHSAADIVSLCLDVQVSDITEMKWTQMLQVDVSL